MKSWKAYYNDTGRLMLTGNDLRLSKTVDAIENWALFDNLWRNFMDKNENKILEQVNLCPGLKFYVASRINGHHSKIYFFVVSWIYQRAFRIIIHKPDWKIYSTLTPAGWNTKQYLIALIYLIGLLSTSWSRKLFPFNCGWSSRMKSFTVFTLSLFRKVHVTLLPTASLMLNVIFGAL